MLRQVCQLARVYHPARIARQLNQRSCSSIQVKDEIDEISEEGDFSNFDISPSTLQKLKANGIDKLFPVQSHTFNAIKDGADVIVQARTGTGKTLAFALPLIQNIKEHAKLNERGRPPKVLALAPTRELAIQTFKEFEKYSSQHTNTHCFYGGVSYDPQEGALHRGVDVVVGTPGRVLDLINRGVLNISQIDHLILDEADTMLDMGFQDVIEDILQHSYTSENKPQTLLFSATVPPWLKQNSKKYLSEDLQTFDLIGTDTNKGATTVEHKSIKCTYWERVSIIRDVIQMYSGKFGKTIIFTTTKQEANELACSPELNVEAQALHGDITQRQRELTLQGFRSGKFNCLIATDVAARGLDIPEVDLVIQTEPPKDVDFYIHRSGRTGRAGRSGVCVVFYKHDQQHSMYAVENRAGIRFENVDPPKTDDIIDSLSGDAIRCLENVKDDVIEHFIEAARTFVETRGADRALAAALAHISGMTEIASRSVHQHRKDYTTYMMTQPIELRNPTIIWRTLGRYFSEEFVANIKDMRMCEDKLSCVFNISNKNVDELKSTWKGDRFATLEKVDHLPDLVEHKPGRTGEYDRPTMNARRPFHRSQKNSRKNNTYHSTRSNYNQNRNNTFKELFNPKKFE